MSVEKPLLITFTDLERVRLYFNLLYGLAERHIDRNPEDVQDEMVSLEDIHDSHELLLFAYMVAKHLMGDI